MFEVFIALAYIVK